MLLLSPAERECCIVHKTALHALPERDKFAWFAG